MEQSSQCSYDYLKIFDGDTENVTKNYSYCGTPQNLGDIRSSGNKLLLKFRSDFVVTSNGFMIQFRKSKTYFIQNKIIKQFLFGINYNRIEYMQY